MADSTALCCYGSGFDVQHRICIKHLKEAYLSAISDRNIEMAAVILKKHRELNS